MNVSIYQTSQKNVIDTGADNGETIVAGDINGDGELTFRRHLQTELPLQGAGTTAALLVSLRWSSQTPYGYAVSLAAVDFDDNDHLDLSSAC